MRRFLGTTLCSLILLAGCGGGGSDAPAERIDAYVGEWSHCTTSLFAPFELLTTWTVLKTGADRAEIVVREQGLTLPSGTACNGTPLEAPRTVRTGQAVVTGEQILDGRTWDSVTLTVDGSTQREVFRTTATSLETSVARTLHSVGARDAQGMPVQVTGDTLRRR
jgi:hypothetical protein